MIYREAGQFKTSYQADEAIFPIAQDRWFIALILIFGFLVVPLFASEYMLQAILIPVLLFSLGAIGLNIRTGYCGQLSLGTGNLCLQALAVGLGLLHRELLRLDPPEDVERMQIDGHRVEQSVAVIALGIVDVGLESRAKIIIF